MDTEWQHSSRFSLAGHDTRYMSPNSRGQFAHQVAALNAKEATGNDKAKQDETTSVYWDTSNPPTPVSGTTAAAMRDRQKGSLSEEKSE